MKVKLLSRNPDKYIRETKFDIEKVPRNHDPKLHPFQDSREYVRALNAVKLERVFAKPFLGSLDGHGDVVSCLGKHPEQLSWLYSGAADGIVKQWNIPLRKCVRTVQAHEGYVRDMTFDPSGESFMTIGDDRNIRFWKCSPSVETATSFVPGENSSLEGIDTPKHTIITKYILNGISHHANKPMYATCGDACMLWEVERNDPVNKLEWGVDSLNAVRFNLSQTNVLGACASDRSVILYDIRGRAPIRKVVLAMKSNAIRWNPMEPYVFALANEDYNAYAFDMRRLKYPLSVYMDHVSAVIDIDYSPTGKELVTGSYDKTLRIFETHKGRSREVYHTKRMQRLTSVLWTLDNKYVISGSDEMNIRLWKARAWEKMGAVRTRERDALNYAEALKEKYAAFPQVKRIARHRQVPRHVYQAKKDLRISKESKKRKESNRRSHTKPGTVPFVPERTKSIVAEHE